MVNNSWTVSIDPQAAENLPYRPNLYLPLKNSRKKFG